MCALRSEGVVQVSVTVLPEKAQWVPESAGSLSAATTEGRR